MVEALQKPLTRGQKGSIQKRHLNVLERTALPANRLFLNVLMIKLHISSFVRSVFPSNCAFFSICSSLSRKSTAHRILLFLLQVAEILGY